MSAANVSRQARTLPNLFLPFIDTELIALLARDGPLRAACVKAAFSDEVVRSLGKPKYHSSNLLVTCPAFVRSGGKDRIIGINPQLTNVGELRDLMRELARDYGIRPVVNDLMPGERDHFMRYAHKPVRFDSLISTRPRTLTLMVLHLFGGMCGSGKLGRSIFDHAPKTIAYVIEKLVRDGIVTKTGTLVRFNENLGCVRQLRKLLQSISEHLPEATKHALDLQEIRKASASGATYRHGQRFHVFGSRVGEAILAFLAINGPSTLNRIAGAVSSVNNHAIDPLLRSGIVAKVEVNANKRFGRELCSLNAAFPVYREIKALLKTDAILDTALPFHDRHKIYEGEDLRDDTVDFDPYAIFGFGKGTARTNVLGVLAHCRNGEADAASILRLLNEHNPESMRYKTLPALERCGLITSRYAGGMMLYRLDPRWPAAKELLDLLYAIEATWREYKEAAQDMHRTFSHTRRKREVTIQARRDKIAAARDEMLTLSQIDRA